jgi:hypothetical protein
MDLAWVANWTPPCLKEQFSNISWEQQCCKVGGGREAALRSQTDSAAHSSRPDPMLIDTASTLEGYCLHRLRSGNRRNMS